MEISVPTEKGKIDMWSLSLLTLDPYKALMEYHERKGETDNGKSTSAE